MWWERRGNGDIEERVEGVRKREEERAAGRVSKKEKIEKNIYKIWEREKRKGRQERTE